MNLENMSNINQEACRPPRPGRADSPLSTFIPRLRGILEALDYPENSALRDLNENITRMQDTFVDNLYALFNAGQINLSPKITLRLNRLDRLQVMDEQHPDKEKINLLLADNPELSASFRDIALQSGILRDLGNLGRTVGAKGDYSSFGKNGNSPYTAEYQLSLKGEMNHFYFT